MLFLRFFLLTLILLSGVILFGVNKAFSMDFNNVAGKTFFFKDIQNFRGKLFKSHPIDKEHLIQQTFQPSCDLLNRLIIPFYFESPTETNDLIFNLFKTSNLEKPLLTASIHSNRWERPLQLGSFDLYGKYHYIWIPPIENSKNQRFTFEIKSNNSNSTTGIYLNRLKQPQISPIQINGQELPGVYAGIFSYCKANLDFQKVTQIILKKTEQEKLFFIFYFLGIAVLIFAIKRAGKSLKKSSAP
jgi:hypothetical protein